PEIVNDRPYAAWFFKVKPTSSLDAELADLMSAEEYDDFVDNLDE
ncbi:MAG: glycine cleavage system protein H, partial [Caldilinea sp.]|nr:glycine cleavage system protein H [Caldilinea sp.]